jgi:hypothetical protein
MKIIKLLLVFSLLSYHNFNFLAYSDNTKFTARQNSNDSILLTWEHISTPSNQEIYLYNNEGLLIKKLNPLSTITSAIFRNLTSGKAYKVIYKSKDPDIELVRNIFLYTPPTNINNLSYQISNDKIILSWQPKKNNDIVEIKLYADDILKKTLSVAAASKGFIINKPNYEKNLFIEYNTKNDIGKSNKAKLQLLSKSIESVDILSKNDKEINFNISAKESKEFVIEIYNQDILLNKITQIENNFTIKLQYSKYKIIITPILLDGNQGEKYIYHYDNTNKLEQINEKVDDKETIDRVEDKKEQAKNNFDNRDDSSNSILDITKYKVIRITEISYDNNILKLTWIDPFEQNYVIYVKNNKEKNWKLIEETNLKNINLSIELSKGLNQFKVVGFVDGIKLTESSSRYIFKKN